MIILPRLSDYYNIPLLQSDVDFAIPFMDEDIPLYVDPFLMWKSPSQMDNMLHDGILSAFNNLGRMYLEGKCDEAVSNLVFLSECDEVGLGLSKTRKGRPISNDVAKDILELFGAIPQIQQYGFRHFEQIQLLVDQISKDRVSDIACSLIKSFLIDYTIDQCQKFGIPLQSVEVFRYDYKRFKIVKEGVKLPVNEESKQPVLLVPKRWLRFTPWLNYDDYFKSYLVKDIEKEYDGTRNRIEVLKYNRENFGLVEKYIDLKEADRGKCENDPLFSKISVASAKRKVSDIRKLPTGKTDNADKKYEELMGQVLTSFLYPYLDFAAEQSRIESGTQIRDIIFYNNTSTDFLKAIYETYDCKQIVIELKNEQKVEREHINQLNRYMSDSFGKFGILFTRNKPPKEIFQNTIDLWSGQRRCILIMDDSDLNLMESVSSSKQRLPIEVIKKKYIEFIRKCPN